MRRAGRGSIRPRVGSGRRDRRGFALLLALLAAAVLTGAVLVIVDEGAIELTMAGNRMEALRTEWLARAAVNRAAWRMRHDYNYRNNAELGAILSASRDSLGVGKYAYLTQAGGAEQLDWILTGEGGANREAVNTNRVDDDLLKPFFIVRCKEDAALSEKDPAANYGEATISVKVKEGERMRPVLWFPVPVDSDLVVREAWLELWLLDATGDDDVYAGPCQLLEDWTEGTGKGTHSGDGCTWASRSPLINWTTAGGTYDTTLVSEVKVGPQPGLHRWDVTSLVGKWVSGDAANCGMLLRARTEKEVNPVIERREFASRTVPDSTHCPALLIQLESKSGGTLQDIINIVL